MQKVGNTTDTADANGEYTNGNIAQGIPPTIINAEMLNTFQRELVNVVEGAGIALSPNVNNQLYLAIKKLSIQATGRLLNIQVFTAGGQYTPTTGMKFILAHMIGGGGASGGTPATSSSQSGGVAAGNSGAYAFIKAYATDIGAGKAINVGSGGDSQVNGTGFAGGTTSIVNIADVTGGYGSGPGSVSATTAVSQPSYSKPVINKYNKTETILYSLGSQAGNFLQSAPGSGTGWLSPASPFPGGERGRGGSGIFVNASSAAQAGWAGNDGAILIMEYA